MLLGHWYLVQPGLARGPLLELVRWTGVAVAARGACCCSCPTGMVSVLNGTIDDGYDGLLGWFWVACAVTTIGLRVVTRLALKERQYSAVMAATGLLYLAILTAFGTDLVARALLSSLSVARTEGDRAQTRSRVPVERPDARACLAPSGAGRSASGWSTSR